MFGDFTEILFFPELYIRKGAKKPQLTMVIEWMQILCFWGLAGVHLVMIGLAIVQPCLPHLPTSLLDQPEEFSVLKVIWLLYLVHVELYGAFCSRNTISDIFPLSLFV